MAFTMKMLLDGIRALGEHADRIAHKAKSGDSRFDQVGFDAGKKYEALLQKYAPKKSGDMAASIKVDSKRLGAWTLVLTPSVEAKEEPKMTWVIDGTPAHTITARNRKYLSFPGRDGGWVVRRSVPHPGTAPNPFKDKAERETRVEAKKRLGDTLQIIFGEFSGR